ncbi:hypothetical protein X975_01608, partial [Stegodyphus mimosarum]
MNPQCGSQAAHREQKTIFLLPKTLSEEGKSGETVMRGHQHGNFFENLGPLGRLCSKM